MGLCPLRRDRVVALASGVKAFVACGGAGGWSGPGSGSAPALTPAIAPQSRCCARWLSLAAGLSFAAQYRPAGTGGIPGQVLVDWHGCSGNSGALCSIRALSASAPAGPMLAMQATCRQIPARPTRP